MGPRSLSALGAGDSYLNLLGLEKGGPRCGSKEGDEGLTTALEGQEGLSRRVEGSEVSEVALLNGSGRQKAEDADRGDEDRWGSAASAPTGRSGNTAVLLSLIQNTAAHELV